MDKPGYVIIACCGCGVNREELIRQLLTERELMKEEIPTPEMPPIEEEIDSKEDNPRDYMAYMRSRRRGR